MTTHIVSGVAVKRMRLIGGGVELRVQEAGWDYWVDGAIAVTAVVAARSRPSIASIDGTVVALVLMMMSRLVRRRGGRGLVAMMVACVMSVVLQSPTMMVSVVVDVLLLLLLVMLED